MLVGRPMEEGELVADGCIVPLLVEGDEVGEQFADEFDVVIGEGVVDRAEGEGVLGDEFVACTLE